MTDHRFTFLRSRRALVLTAVFVLQALVLHGLAREEKLPPATPLAGFPVEIGSWQMLREQTIDRTTQEVLRASETMSRYYGDTLSQHPVSLFVAYFRSQRSGQAPHSPKNCLPGAGWAPSNSGTLAITVPGERDPIRVNRYVVSKGDQKSVVLYWYQSRRRVIASEYSAKIHLVIDAIRDNRTDTALVRIVAPVSGADEAGAAAAAESFVRNVFPVLRQRLPS